MARIRQSHRKRRKEQENPPPGQHGQGDFVRMGRASPVGRKEEPEEGKLVSIQGGGRWLLGVASRGRGMRESLLGQKEGGHVFWEGGSEG